MPEPSGAIMLVGAEQIVARQIGRLAEELRLRVTAGATPSDPPAVLVVHLSGMDSVEEVRRWRAACPDLVIAAYLSLPERDVWEAAERAGADLVVNRGALARSLRKLLIDLGAQKARRKRFPLFDAAEVAGRLGLVQAVGDTPVGPVAVYRTDDGLVAVEGACPHAGALLAQGALEDGVLTCPAHGSRFEVATGERVRGPADRGLRVFSAVEEEGRVWLLWT